jgi:hypothetical protein
MPTYLKPLDAAAQRRQNATRSDDRDVGARLRGVTGGTHIALPTAGAGPCIVGGAFYALIAAQVVLTVVLLLVLVLLLLRR